MNNYLLILPDLQLETASLAQDLIFVLTVCFTLSKEDSSDNTRRKISLQSCT